MDELLHHCLRELAFDGDFGSDVTRLQDFIVGFYDQRNALQFQNLDDSFAAYVWSLLVQQSTVVVGVVPEGNTSEVWIAPQVSAKRKATARGSEQSDSTTPPKLEAIPERKDTPLNALKEKYGGRLRIAANPDVIFAGITGSHLRSTKLSPMVFSALQIITRGRDAGVSVVDLGKRSGYDQKTCFYLVKQLTDLDLVLKVRRGGVGTHFVIHRYFYERNCSWKAIREEEHEAESNWMKAEEHGVEDADKTDLDTKQLNFTPIDARHLSSYPLISQRVVKLLRASKNHMHASKDMLMILGFSNPTKTDRRFFKTRINEMVQRGVIEKVIVPNKQKKSPGSSVKCFRLIEGVSNDTTNEGLILAEDLIPGAEAVLNVRFDSAIHKQIIDLVEKSGTKGVTLNDLSASLRNFDKRTIELLLARSERNPPPCHLLDLHIVGIMETSGRERRRRYYTIRYYYQFVNDESLDNESGCNDMDLDGVGGFSVVNPSAFYETEGETVRYTSSFKSKHDSVEKKKKARVYKNPILPDGTVKRGRPRKKSEAGEVIRRGATVKHQNKRKNVENEEEDSKRPSKKVRMSEVTSDVPTRAKRGRPPKQKPVLPMTAEASIPKRRRLTPSPLPPADFVLPVATRTSSQPPENLTTGITPDNIPSGDNLQTNEFSSSVIANTQSLHVHSHSEHPVLGDVLKGSEQTPEMSSRSHLNLINKPTIRPSGTPNRVNISHLRRENEFIRLLESAGGIIAIHSREFHEGHMKLLQELSQSGEPVSAPVGTKIDKRTMFSTFASLERKGRVKQLKTSTTTPTGLRRAASLVFLPDIDENQLDRYLCDLGRSSQPQLPQLGSFVKINEQVDYGAGPSVPRGIPPLQLLQIHKLVDDGKEGWAKNLDRAQQLFANDDATIRDVFLAERTTMVQLYGFILGKALRCRQLHISVLETLENRTPSLNIVSHEKRIVETSFFTHHITVGLYCSLVAPVNYDEELLALLATDVGRETLVRDLPINLQSVLHVGRSRARTCLLDMLEKLRELKLVTPLQQSQSSTPMITCAPNGQHPIAFDTACLEGWTINTGATAPSYWWFHESAPIYLWVASETDPPLWKTASVSRRQDGIDYWRDLQTACMTLESAVNVQNTGGLEAQSTSISMARSFRRIVSWRSEYFLTWHQTQYLKQFTEASAMSPLDIPDPIDKETKLTRICWVTSAPREAVETFYRNNKEKLTKVLEKLRQKNKRTEEAKVSLAKKSEEARLQREHIWSSLLTRCYPDEVPAPAALRIERVHKQFLHAGSIKDMDRWEEDIQAALRETDLASIKGLRISSKQSLPRPAPSPLTIQPSASQDELSIESLIEMQGPRLEHDSQNRKRKRKSQRDNGVEAQKKGIRRHRFQWNPEFDELARDASVIIRARCRELPRLDWGAFEQVFPAVPRNTVRQRLAHIKETPGNEAYLRRLEDIWYELWRKHGGSEMLPDDNLQSASNFDLVNHLRFLRTHVDKQALRVGIPQTTEKQLAVIPASIEQIQEQYEIIERERVAPDWDYIWNTVIEEGREKKLKRQSFVHNPEKLLPSSPDSNEIVIAESSVKMVMGSPLEHYDSEQASLLLKSCGDETVKSATKNLLSQGVLSKMQRDPRKLGPGRLLKISEPNQNAIGGSINQDTYQDAVLLLEDMDPNDSDWHEWPLIATDGDCAALIQLVSENKVDFRVDTSLPQAARPALDWNSKKADDDHIETVIRVQYHLELRDMEETSSRTEESSLSATDGHGFNEEGVIACCRRNSSVGLVDCSVCLDEAWNRLHGVLDLNSCETARELLTVLRQSKEGTKKSDIMNSFALYTSDLPVLLSTLLTADIPQVYWVGYKSLVLVSAHHVAKWGVAVSQKPLVYIFPRRWMDIEGRKVLDFWQAAVRAVMSTIIFRPGIPQSEIRWRLRSVYDRQEIVDILRYLSGEGYLCVRYDNHENNFFFPYDEQEESRVYWFVGEKHWYHA